MSKKIDKEFQELALKVASGKNTPDEEAALHAFLRVKPELKFVYDDLKQEIESVRDALGLLAAMQAPPEPVPEESYRDFEATIDEIYGPRRNTGKHDFRSLSRMLVAFATVLLLIGFAGGIVGGFKETVTTNGILWTHPTAETPSGSYFILVIALFTYLAAGILKFLDYFLNRKP